MQFLKLYKVFVHILLWSQFTIGFNQFYFIFNYHYQQNLLKHQNQKLIIIFSDFPTMSRLPFGLLVSRQSKSSITNLKFYDKLNLINCYKTTCRDIETCLSNYDNKYFLFKLNTNFKSNIEHHQTFSSNCTVKIKLTFISLNFSLFPWGRSVLKLHFTT